ncbi:thioesterase family protein [Marivirga harenae]|uniref:thioesterase family protein n=1 Tax=Marivirga harenae TaxID=2010992 RepID=UPI0026DFFB3C|nr:thioesterase family protein [Marivirga harenae]WKV10655.1 thioesterase family protein [Marivirga harenae]|tara:strand:- start:36148 stop:36570 length:423 start_codon:yes stop_codon:yes gene_type:complete
MSRIKIDEPSRYLFTAKITTRITDLNYGGHVGNDRIFAFMHDARVQFLKSLGYESELNIEGLGNIQTDAAISYKAEIFAHEDILIKVGLTDLNKYGGDFIYKFTKSDGKLAAIGKTGIVFFDYQKRKIANMPESFINKLE